MIVEMTSCNCAVQAREKKGVDAWGCRLPSEFSRCNCIVLSSGLA